MGLCHTCAHHRKVGNRKGARFYLCQRSIDDPSYPRYPVLPKLECPGYEKGPDDPWATLSEEEDE